MCGRFTLQTPAETLQRLFGFAAPGPSWDPSRTTRARFNIAPTQPVLVARPSAEGGRAGVWAAWGMTAAKNRLAINARSESVFERPAFRTAARRSRVLVFADGFLEWRKVDGERRPFHISREDGSPLVFAGVSALDARGADGERRLCCAILTTAANEDVAPLHDRMPVILEGAAIDAWLDPALDAPSTLEPLLAPAPAGLLRVREVSQRVNTVDHDDPACLAEPEPASRSRPASDPMRPPTPRRGGAKVPESQLGFDF